VVALLLAGATPAGASNGGYGKPPSWLPKANVPVGRVVTATAAHPWLAIEGDSVRVVVPGGSALVTTVGPSVPEEGSFPVPATSPCTFTVTFARVAGSIPLVPRAFSITDEQGHVHRPLVTVLGGGAPPRRLVSGRRVTLSVSGVLPTGNGALDWAPTGGRPTVSWDFDVEID